MRVGGKASADAKRETCFDTALTLAYRGGEADIVDFGVGAPMAAAGDGYFEFARQIIELRVAAKLAVDPQGQRRGVTNLAGIQAGEGAAGDVASNVAASARSG